MNRINSSNKSIQKKVVFQVSSLIAATIFTIIGFVIYVVTNFMETQAQSSLKNELTIVQSKLEQRIGYLVENTLLLAKNDLMVNALIDADGKEVYLPPLVKNFKEGKDVISINIVDFDAKVIYKTKKDIPQYNESEQLRLSLALGETTTYIQEKNHNLIIISPIKYYDTTQGSLIAVFDLKKTILSQITQDETNYIKVVQDKLNIFENNFDENKNYYKYKLLPNINIPNLYQLNLSIELGVEEAIYKAPIEDTTFKLFVLGLVVVIIGIIIATLLSKSITNPIIELYTRVKNIDKSNDTQCSPLGTNDELDILASAFDERTQKLKDSLSYQSKLLSLFDIKNTALFIWDIKGSGEVTYVSSNIKNLLGYEVDDFTNKKLNYEKCVHEEDIQRVNKELELALENNHEYVEHQPYRLKTKEDDLVWVLDRTIISKDEKGNKKELIGYITDISDYKLQEARLYNSEKMASLGEMIGNIAHQWRQPLSVISTASTGLKIQKEYGALSDEEFVRLCDTIDNNAQYLSATIDDFKNYIKGNRDKTTFNLDDSIETTLKLVEPSIKAHHINIIKDFEADLKITGFKNELVQCFMNLYNNSKDVLKDKEEQNRLIFISTKKDTNKVIITIKDSGGGIKDEIIDRIFEPYFTTKHQSQGTGLGLHMTFNLIEKGMNGHIEVTNKTFEYKGTTFTGAQFTIILPLKEED